jgi:hypothetical protein
MSVEQIGKTLLQLPPEERRKFADWFYQHENEIAEPRDGDEIHPEVRAELERRLQEIEEHPKLLEPWVGTTDRIRAQLHEKRRQKNLSR